MMVWFLDNPARSAKERQAVEALQERVDWLRGVVWKLEGAALRMDAGIEAHGYVYPVKMVYPATFPANPPTVWPLEEERWSGHQWGAGGELCLERGPDNWDPEITGDQMLVSAHRLLYEENPKGEGERNEVPSRHRSTLGQSLRGDRFNFRLLETDSLRRYLSELPRGFRGTLQIVLLMRKTGVIRAFVREILLEGRDPWIDPALPPQLEVYGSPLEGFILDTPLAPADLRIDTIQDIESVLASCGLLSEPLAQALADPETFRLILLYDREGGPHSFLLPSSLTELPVVSLNGDEPGRRLGMGGEILGCKKVGLVGLGSAGSKIALTLARSGVSRFVLVDPDVLLPENLVRHTLDWRDVGDHKVVGMREQLRLCAPAADVEIWPFQIAGQESTASAAGALKSLAACELIIDATAEAKVLNQLALLVESFPIPLVWLEIYAGGIGGMVARSRPGKDPSPLRVRDKLHAWLADQEAPPAATLAPYIAEGEGGEPLIATDADVSVIAAHAARLALDVLTVREPSIFPYSAYLIGLARGWRFTQPFHTIPVDVGLPESEEKPEPSPELVTEGLEFIRSLIQKIQDGD
jgi:sulfur-carrier protein adenylyltransferase/sulfurtransferase